MKFGIKTCKKCKEKYVTDEGTDNAYSCKCGESLMKIEDKWYYVPDNQLIKFIEKYYWREK